ncbi:MAG TPA: 5'-3' exonuclease H3TH domain-containing protein [Polyangiaceae bacterium]|nr:5'-3' exonuclease H3TH domain-containing protein [Polyangiaceae bacterium]
MSSEPDRAGPILLIDAFSLLYRAFFALPPMSTSAGIPTAGLYGFSSLLLKLLREQTPRGGAIGMDAPRATFRHDLYAGYKASRPAAPTPLTEQIRRLPELFDAFGFPVFTVPGFEADDVLATLAQAFSARGDAPLIVTGDLDALQCALGTTRVHVVGRGVEGRTYDEAAVIARFEVTPGELPDWKALAGDPTDEIPGVPGIGAKRASSLVRQFGGVDGLLSRLDEVTPPSVRAALVAHGEKLPLWRDLALLRTNVPLQEPPRWAPFDDAARTRVRALFEGLEFRSLLPRLDALALDHLRASGSSSK